MKAKRVLASLLTAALIVTGLPVTAFAADASGQEGEGWSADHMTYFYYDGDELKKAAATTKTDAPTCTEAEQITHTVKVNGETIKYGPVDKEGGKPAKGQDWGEPHEETIKNNQCKREGS